MSEEKKNVVNTGTALDFLEGAEIRQIVRMAGIYVRGFVEDWKGKDRTTNKEISGTYGCIQILQPSGTDTKRLVLKSVKVNESEFGLVDILNKRFGLQAVVLDCEIKDGYGDQKSKTILLPQQSSLK